MKRLLFFSATLAVCSALAYTNVTLNISAGGGAMSGGGYTSIGSFAPLGGTVSQSTSLYNYSGFASGFILQPKTAYRGLPDEWNPDNDRDGLQDGEEIIAGSSLYNPDTDNDGLGDFDEVRTHGSSPNMADSDTDGMNDADELIAGTSLTNRSSVFSIAFTLLPNGKKTLSWSGVQGRNYTFQYCDSLSSDTWQSYPSEVSGSGSLIAFTDAAFLPTRFYRVKVRVAEP